MRGDFDGLITLRRDRSEVVTSLSEIIKRAITEQTAHLCPPSMAIIGLCDITQHQIKAAHQTNFAN